MKTNLINKLALLILAALITSCSAFVDVEQPSGARVSAAILIGTDATEVSRPGSWKATGINNSNSVGTVKKGVVATQAIDAVAPGFTDLTGSLGSSIESLAKP